MEQTAKSNKMADMPVKKLMLTMGVPIIISMMLQAVYNIVDTAFVGNMEGIGTKACTALTLAFPMQMLMIAISIGTGVGTNALLSKKLGENDKEQASKVAGNALFLGIVIYAVFLLFGLFGVRIYITSQINDEFIGDMAINYLTICCIFSFGTVIYAIYEKILQATGHSMYSTIAQISGAVVNIVLDPIMIYGWFGCPEMGVEGAAYATVIGQLVSGVLAMIFHLKVNKDISNELKYLKPSGKIIKEIYAIGLPAIIAQALMSVMTYGLNKILPTSEMVTAYGIYYKVQQFASLFGLSGKPEEQLFVSASQIVSISFIFAGINVAFQGVFQALNSGVESLIISVCRQLIFVLPVAWCFTVWAQNSSNMEWIIWTTFPIAEVISAAIACFLMRRVNQKKIDTL